MFKLFVLILIITCANGASLEDEFRHPYPFVVSLLYAHDGTLTKFGAGVIVRESTILTSATTVKNTILKKPNVLYALAGVLRSYDLDYKYAQLRNITKIHIFPHYSGFNNGEPPKDDLAFLKVDKPFTPALNVQVAKLSRKADVTGIGDIIGWGASDFPTHATQSDILLYATLPVVNQTDCEKAYHFTGNNRFCVGTKDQVACIGDGGGPFVQKDQYTGEPIIAGIASVGTIPCTKEPTLYTNVGSYLLEDIIELVNAIDHLAYDMIHAVLNKNKKQ